MSSFLSFKNYNVALSGTFLGFGLWAVVAPGSLAQVYTPPHARNVAVCDCLTGWGLSYLGLAGLLRVVYRSNNRKLRRDSLWTTIGLTLGITAFIGRNAATKAGDVWNAKALVYTAMPLFAMLTTWGYKLVAGPDLDLEE